MSDYCELCHSEPVFTQRRGRQLCSECANWDDYWTSLTPEEKHAEQVSMDNYVDDGESV